ncbi:MAG: hypothetical protein ACFB10_22410 [Salibacteraceae bacterium]
MHRLQYFPLVSALVGLLLFAACSKDDDSDPEPATPVNPSLPAAIAGSTANLEFTTANPGAPYSLGDQVLFTFSTSGAMAIDIDPSANNGNEVSVATLTLVGSEYQWEDTGNGYRYTLSLNPDESINEVNVSDLSNAFLGQFTPVGAGAANLTLVKNLAGTYTVTAVNVGAHTRMTVTIDADGNIDFDTGLQLVTEDYELISDRLDVLNAIFIDMAPYPSEPYPRIELYVDPGTQALHEVHYAPQYPNGGGGGVEIMVN